MTIVDLSHPLQHGASGFPDDPKLEIQPHATVETHQFNTTKVSFGTHQGTHLDAMFHFFPSGRTLDQMPLDWFFGPARVLRIAKLADEEIGVEDLRVHSEHLVEGARIIVDTGWHRQIGGDDFFTRFPSFTLEAARFLASRRIRLLGMDIPTPGKQWLELHHVLLAPTAEIVLVEALANLSSAPDTFIFAGFPLNFVGRDGSPIRAVAICNS